MMLPAINTIPRNRLQVLEFRGLNKSNTCAENEFSSMRNMSADHYPWIETTANRALEAELTKGNGLFAKDKLYCVDETSFKEVGGSSSLGTVTDSRKTFVGMGAYIIILPDKKVYNTSDGTMKSMDASWTQTASATFANDFLTESEIDPNDATVYVKITSTNIGKNFNKYDGVTITGITTSQIKTLNKTAVIYEKADNWILIVGTDLEGNTYTQSSGMKIERKAPDMDYVCELDNRLWGCSSANHEIYASKLGDPFNWNCFEGISTDSYAATVGSDGDFTGAVSHLGYVLFFKEECLHKVYGSKPSQFQIITTKMRGVRKGCEKSLCVVNENLYYVSNTGVMIYQGALPSAIGKQLGDKPIVEALAAGINNKYYLRCEELEDAENEETSSHLYILDDQTGIWTEEEPIDAEYMVYFNHYLGWLGDNKVMFFNTEEELPKNKTWEMVTGPINTMYQNKSALVTGKKRLTKLALQFELHPGSYVDVSVSYDGGLFEPVKNFSSAKLKSESLMFIPHRCDHLNIKFHGGGYFALKSMTKYLEQGSDD